ncbi:MAG: hypothetical protein J7L53_08120 [Deltaproteobacteria bacterium]|nr:hypothetical protein [Deltaproteobacteria bacterium]
MKIIWHVLLFLQKAVAGILFHKVFVGGIPLESLDLSDVLERDIRDLMNCPGCPSDFKLFHIKEEYNKDLLVVFQSHRNSFFLDYNHRDGHFRV